jgi:hypothetical protein
MDKEINSKANRTKLKKILKWTALSVLAFPYLRSFRLLNEPKSSL